MTIRAVAHPIRLALLEALNEHGALTATEAAELVEESPSGCSFHMRQLAKYGFVEEAGGAAGRNRPWRLTPIGSQAPVLFGRFMSRHQSWLKARAGLSSDWRDVTGQSEFLLYITPAELRTLDAEVTAVLRRHAARVSRPSLRPAGARPIEVLFFAFPLVQAP